MSQFNARLSRVARMFSLAVCAALLSTTAPHITQTAVAQSTTRLPAPPWPAACRAANGQPVIPQFKPGWNYAWGFITNFDQAPSETTVTGCLTEAVLGPLGGTAYYATLTTCIIENNIATPRVRLGGGSGVFDGNVFLQCRIGLQAAHQPDHFYVRARALLPLPGINYTLMTSTPASFAAQLDGACNLTLRSTYVSVLTNVPTVYANAAGGAKCNTPLGIGSRIQPSKVSHFVDGLMVTPVHTPSLSIGIPMTYVYQIGAAGTAFTLDEFVIDPQPLRCCSGG